MKMSIGLKNVRSKIIALFLLVSLMPLVIFSLTSYALSSHTLVENSKELTKDLVDSKAQSISEWLNSRMDEISLAAKTDILQSMDPERINKYLIQVKEQSPVYDDINFAGTDGITIASSDGHIGISVVDRDYFQNALDGTPVISDILTSKVTGNRIINIASPVLDDSGETIGVVFAASNFDILANSFLNDENEVSKYLLLDNDGIIQVIENDEMIGLPVEEANFHETLTQVLTKDVQSDINTYMDAAGEESVIVHSSIPLTGYDLYMSTPMNEIYKDVKPLQMMSIWAVVISAIVVIAISILVSGNISKPISQVTKFVQRVASGDLTRTEIAIKRKDEIGDLGANFTLMVSSLHDIIDRVRSTSEQVAAAAQQLSASTEEVASGSSDQANSVQNIAHLFKEFNEAIESVAIAANEASELGNQMVQIAKEGGQVVEESLVGMQEVNRKVAQLEGDSNQIGSIIEVIDDIAEQTNLLALNAAIEAARAGEQGRGFAVVADEVRKLAERSSSATKQITEIIKNMQTNMKDSVDSVKSAVSNTSHISLSFEKLINIITESSLKTNEIAAASEEQSAQSKEVLQTIETISASTEESAAASEEMAQTTQSLAMLAEDLRQSVDQFKTK